MLALRLGANGLRLGKIAKRLRLGRATIGDHLQQATRAGPGWPLDVGLTGAQMDTPLCPPPSRAAVTIAQPG